MVLSPYLAMTATEIQNADTLPEKLAYMACHFSPYGTGLSNLPSALPKDSLLIVNDRTPICGHDPEEICMQLRQVFDACACSGILLDFQRLNEPETANLVFRIVSEFPEAAVSDLYAKELDGPVFLPPPPLTQPLAEYLTPWNGREIWLEISPEHRRITVTEQGSHEETELEDPVPHTFQDDDLFCAYRTEILEDAIHFHLSRTGEQLRAMLDTAATLGVTNAVGLYQQLKGF